MDSRGGYVSKILYVEMKESGPLGGVRRARPPRSANEANQVCFLLCKSIRRYLLLQSELYEHLQL